MSHLNLLCVFAFAVTLSALTSVGCSKTESNAPRSSPTDDDRQTQLDTRSLITDPTFLTPEDALRAYYQAVDVSDLETSKQLTVFLTEKYQIAFLNAMMSTPSAIKKYNRVVTATFGETAQVFPTVSKQFLDKIETIPVEYSNTTAAVWNHQPEKKLKLIKHRGGWLLDMRDMERKAPDVSVFQPMHEMASCFTTVAGMIEDGKLTTGEEIRDEFIRLRSGAKKGVSSR